MALRRVKLQPRPFADYRGIVEDDLYRQVEDLKASLREFHVIEVNATPTGGGVAEMLQSEIPLLLDLGLDAEWWVIAEAEPAFFDLTKKLHNLLQGKEGSLSQAEKDLYLRHAERFARDLRGLSPDFWLIHDPQPLAVASYLDDAIPRAWRSHIDTSHPNPVAMDFLLPYMEMYDWTIFSLREYAPPALQGDNLLVFKPAIDPLTAKNLPLAPAAADAILSRLGIDPSRPLMVQVSRFDPWKDPIGVVDAYRQAKKEVYDLQLAMVGVFSAKDDPEGPRIYAEVAHHAGPDPDVHLYTDPALVGDREVNAFQTGADVVLQKSLREGFGLTVTEAMWKGKAVVGGNAGGIRSQIEDGVNGFLVNDAQEAAQRTVELLRNQTMREKMGAAAQETARRFFLLPRLVHEYLDLFAESVERPVAPTKRRAA